MEAVKKLQASSKLLQKVTYAWRLCLELAPPTRRLASACRMCGVRGQWAGEAGQCALWFPFPRLSTESWPLFQNNLNLLRDLAVHIALSLRNSPDWGGVVTLHR